MRSSIRRAAWAVPVLALAGLVGCAGDKPEPGAAGKKGAKTSTVEVTDVRFAGLDAAISEQKGTVVLVDFWATWCGPCVKKFPHLVELHTKYADKGLTCISVSEDRSGPVPGSKDDILAFLKSKGATFPNFIREPETADEDKMAKRFGSFDFIPYMVMFDKTGKRVWNSSDEPLSDSALDKRIEDELAK